MKKIIIFHHYNSTVGAGLSLLHIISKIDKSKYDIKVYLPQIKGDLGENIKNMGVSVEYVIDTIVPYAHYSGSKRSFMSIKNTKNIIKIFNAKKKILDIIRKEKADIILVNSMTLFWIGRIIKNKIPTVCFHRETYIRGLLGFRTRYIKYVLCKYFTKVVFISNYDREITSKRQEKFHVITDKVEGEKYQKYEKKVVRKELKLPEDKKLILFVGGPYKLKGADIILKAYNAINNKNVGLVFLQYNYLNDMKSVMQKIKINFKIGYRNKLENYIDKKKMRERVFFRPNTREVEKYYKACDVIVFPSRYPHQARPIYEAGFAKIPILITDFKNTREFINKENGWLIKRNSIKEWIKTLNNILIENEDVNIKVNNNYEKVILNNNINTLSYELEKVLNDLNNICLN